MVITTYDITSGQYGSNSQEIVSSTMATAMQISGIDTTGLCFKIPGFLVHYDIRISILYGNVYFVTLPIVFVSLR